VILPGDVIGFPVSFFDRSIYSVVAVSDLTYNGPLDSYARLCYEQPQFGLALSWLAAYEAAIYAEHIVDLGRRTQVGRGRDKLRSSVLAGGHSRRAGAERAASQSRDAAIAGGAIDHQPMHDWSN
jgi:hypothetical protein